MYFQIHGLSSSDDSSIVSRVRALRPVIQGEVPEEATPQTLPVLFRKPDLATAISFSSNESWSWTSGSFSVLHLSGNVEVRQGTTVAKGAEAIVLIGDESELQMAAGNTMDEGISESATIPVKRAVVYLERDIVLATGTGDFDRIEESQSLIHRFHTAAPIVFPENTSLLSGATPEIFERARSMLRSQADAAVVPVQYAQQSESPQRLVSPFTGQMQTVLPDETAPAYDPMMPGATTTARPSNQRPQPERVNGVENRGKTRVEFQARDSRVDLNLKRQTNPQNSAEVIYLVTGGVRLNIDSPDLNRLSEAGTASQASQQAIIMADNVVAWQSALPDGESRWEMYLEGNVVYGQGTRTIHADRMYYDANLQRGTILDADMLTPVAQYNGLVRLKSDVIQQMDANTIEAFGPAITTSRMGVPRYWMQSDRLTISRESRAAIDPVTGRVALDPGTGVVRTDDEYFLDSRNNRIYAASLPVFYWPRFRTSLDDPTLYLDRIRLGNDSIFGTQVMTGWNLFQVLGIRNRPENTRWIGVVDYLSERGLGFGTETDYQRDGLFGYPGRAEGYWRSWFINDSGLDNLGLGRRRLTPEVERRGNILGRHRHQFAPGYDLRAEVGYLTDRNFLEQYYERRWDTEKDYTTGIWLGRNAGTQSFNLIADVQVNDFFTQTSWLPRFDHFVLGQPLFGDRAVWHGHSSFGYGKFRPANSPLDPVDAAPFDLLEWESADTHGVRMTTRQELDFPIQLGPVKMVPYMMGDLSYWQEALDENDLVRAYGQTGLRLSIPFWKVDPTVHSNLWNVNGLAHKLSLDAEFLYADASQDINELPLYDPLDDDAQESFRHRFAFNTFGIPPGGNVPLKYDERYFAYRRGMQSYVTGASPEIADDMAAVKLGARQRFQTRRGQPGRERIIDWVTLDTQVVLFPEADRDNFGSTAGLFEYDFRWHVGDRVSLVSDGFADFFSQGLRTVSVGAQLSRPTIGDVYIGYRMIEGPISSNIISANLSYRMSDKWGVKLGTAIDFGATGTIGNSASLIYIGESFLWRFGVNADTSRDNIGVVFGLEPRFLPRGRTFNPGGVPVGPAGARWLE